MKLCSVKKTHFQHLFGSPRSNWFTWRLRWSFTDTFPVTQGISLLWMIATPAQLFQARTHSSSKDGLIAYCQRFDEHTFSQEWALAGGVPNVYDLNAHRIHRTINVAWKIESDWPDGLSSCGPCRFCLCPCCWSRDHARWIKHNNPLAIEVWEHLRPSGS